MATHSFDTNEACKYGVDKAIILSNLRFWLEKNKANDKHAHDNYYWTYNSASAFSELFPYFTRSKIQRLLKELESSGAVLSGNYNKVSYDRTKWYSMPEFSISQKREIHCSNLDNGMHVIEQPIPDSKPDNKTDIVDYTAVKEIFNRVMVRSPKVVKLNEKRKRLVRNLFKFGDLDLIKFEAYLQYLHDTPSWEWSFRKRIGQNGIQYNECSFEYFMTEDTYLKAKEEI